ncbi:Putative membrane protein [Gloeomargarita lithophora Alchichica-D10]|uniref:Membrane protein n=1 Tax=Gloeomargarita lithophora Alchichica-D10 TaxID=1188229 RepID=A0A1J0ABD1_9CYAN|nr:DUF1345 domain-containing protein [Gloeomargarita lithophora]APB33242.1 Putative membrane protein [Gloeomargarita lithophora Alchichica-D10]
MNRKTILALTHPKWRAIFSLMIALIVWALLSLLTKLHGNFIYLITYNLAVLFYQVAFFTRISLASVQDTYRFIRNQEPSNWFMLASVIALSWASIMSLISLADTPKDWTRFESGLHIFLSILALFSSWVLVNIFFGLHYARLYYSSQGKNTAGETTPEFDRGLLFTEDDWPHYWDFLYESFVIAMTFATADVNISRKDLRILALFHGMFSFMYNLIILGLVVNYISNIFGN